MHWRTRSIALSATLLTILVGLPFNRAGFVDYLLNDMEDVRTERPDYDPPGKPNWQEKNRYDWNDCQYSLCYGLSHYAFTDPWLPEANYSEDAYAAGWRPESCIGEFLVDPVHMLYRNTLAEFFAKRYGCVARQRGEGTSRPVPTNSHEIVRDFQVLGRPLQPGDVIAYKHSQGWHAIAISEVLADGSINYTALNEVGMGRGDFTGNKPLEKVLGDVLSLQVCHIDDALNGCNGMLQYSRIDSTILEDFQVKHAYICCWHENLAHEPPWSNHPSPYACLNWQETQGTTWDTLIWERANLAGCYDVQLRFRSAGGFDGGEVRGSTDDGQTWPHAISGQYSTGVNLPWAAGQREVRIAWIYCGPVQPGAWCVDDVELWGKPRAHHDVCVSQFSVPSEAYLTQGRRVSPVVFVWNRGFAEDSVRVTLHIGQRYADTQIVSIPSLNKAIVTFDRWTPTPGVYSALARASVAADENPANDSVCMLLNVVADTWVRKFPVYSGLATKGSGLATTDSNTIYCNPSHNKKFARYLVTQDLWKTRASAPQYLNAGLCWAGGRYMYALRGSSTKTFFRFDTLANSWCQRADAPAKTGLGAGMVYGGGSWLYALRGDRKTDFWRYHTVNNAWESRASLPGAAQDGAALVWTGGDYIYCLRGDNKTEFYRYQISANQWTSLSPVPVTVDYGGSLCFDPLTNRLYCLPGRGRLCFYTYNIASGNWSSRQPIPRQISGGSALAWCDHSVYAVLGGHGPANFQRYSPPAGGDEDFGYAPEKPNPAPLFVPGFLGGKDEDLFPTDEEGIAAPANPVYTPDGSSIIFVAYDSTNGRMGLYRKPVEGGDAVLLTDDSVSYSKPACNSDGSSIAAAGDSGLYLVSPDDGTSVKVADGIVDAPRWLPGDTMLMFEKWDDNRETHTVHLVRPDGTEDTCLTGEADYFAPQPLFQGGFVCARQKGELGQLGKMDQDGNEDWLTSDYCENACPTVSPGGNYVAFQKLDETRHWQIYVMSLAEGWEKRLTDGTSDCQSPSFSPDGAYIAYSKWPVDTTGEGFSKIAYVPRDSGAEVDVNPPDAIKEHPEWSPDCAYIVFELEVPQGGQDDAKGVGLRRTLARVPTGVTRRDNPQVAAEPRPVFALHQNVPNPFRLTTAISYAVPGRAVVELQVFDPSGRLTRSLTSATQRPGRYTAIWDGTDQQGRRVAAGTYFYVLKSDGRIAKRRMLLVR